jgi:hypothetical protein
MTRAWSLDARVLARPAAAFRPSCVIRRALESPRRAGGRSSLRSCSDVVFRLFAVPAPDPRTFVREVVEAVEELLR